jgi:pyruvate dehydrogenase E1 component alpha subunit
VPRELIAEWEKRDPIRRLVTYMEEHELMQQSERETMDERITRQLDEALDWAEKSSLPDAATQNRNVYATMDSSYTD